MQELLALLHCQSSRQASFGELNLELQLLPAWEEVRVFNRGQGDLVEVESNE
jgi:hypothetical protein